MAEGYGRVKLFTLQWPARRKSEKEPRERVKMEIMQERVILREREREVGRKQEKKNHAKPS